MTKRTTLLGRKCSLTYSDEEYTFLEFSTGSFDGYPHPSAILENKNGLVVVVQAHEVKFKDKL